MAVIDKDLGYNAIVKRLNDLNKTEIVAGILKDAGRHKSGESLVNIATWNEYGTSRIPSRPFIRIAADTNRRNWEKLSEKCVKDVIDGQNAKNAVGAIGKRMVKDIQAVFGDTSKLRGNAPATIRQKGADNPLINTGQLQGSVKYRVEG